MKRKTIITALLLTVVVAVGAYAVCGDGSLDLTSDPLVSLSYLNEVFWPKIEQAIADAGIGGSHRDDTSSADEIEPLPPTETSAGNEYEVLHLIEGDIVLAETPCEIILRSGSATAHLSGNESGIADLTSGGELYEGDELSANHLLLIPRGGDGRGFVVTSAELYIMVRGGYSIVTE